MDFTLHPSLQQFCTQNLAVELWTSEDVRNDLIQFITMKNDLPRLSPMSLYELSCFETTEFESKILAVVLEKVEELPLPRILKDGVRKVLKPIANEIYEGYVGLFTEKVQPYFEYYFNRLHWMPWGQVDRQKTVECLLKNHNIDIELRYFWSCTYMCGYYNSKYWYECKEEMKEHIESRELSRKYNFQFVDSWKCRRDQLKELMKRLNVNVPNWYPKKCVTEMIIGEKYEMTFQQFWLSSSEKKKIDIVDKFAKKIFYNKKEICCSEVLFFLMTQMTEEQRAIYFENNARFIGILMLQNWPRREMFLPTVKIMWNYFDHLNLMALLIKVAYLGSCGFRDVDESHELFRAVWVHDPDKVKEVVYDQWWTHLREVFVISMNVKSVKLLLKNISNPTEKSVIFDSVANGIHSFPFYTMSENLNLLDDFLREIALTENDLTQFKTELIYYSCREIFEIFIREGKLDLVDKILNWALCSEDEIIRFKMHFVWYNGVWYCQERITENDLTAIDQLTNWGFSSEEDKTKFKNKVFLR